MFIPDNMFSIEIFHNYENFILIRPKPDLMSVIESEIHNKQIISLNDYGYSGEVLVGEVDNITNSSKDKIYILLEDIDRLDEDDSLIGSSYYYSGDDSVETMIKMIS